MKSVTRCIPNLIVPSTSTKLYASTYPRILSKKNDSTTLSDSKSDVDQAAIALTLSPLQFSIESGLSVKSITAALTNFNEAKNFYRQKVLQGNHELPNIYTGNPSMQNVFRQIFPEIVKSRGITMLHEQDASGELFSRWKENGNIVTLELMNDSASKKNNDSTSVTSNSHLDAVFIGGPSTMAACLLYQLRYPDHRVRHFFVNRYDSNYDGSAYYYHQRDAAPVYVNRVNRGPYCLYIDLYKRLINPEKLAYQAETNRHHVKISLNWSNLKLRYIFTIFLPNVWHMINDLWIKNKKNAKMAHVIEHARRAVPIVYAISDCTKLPVENMLIYGKHKANYAGFIGSKTNPKDHFTWLNEFAHIPFHEISCEGFGSEVSQVLNFPNDGLIAPTVIENLQKQMDKQAELCQGPLSYSISRNCSLLKKLLVQPITSEHSASMRITGIEWIDMTNGTTNRTNVDRIFISLGPSGQIQIVSPKLTLLQHALKLVGSTFTSSSMDTDGGYKATLSSLRRHTLNTISNRFFRASKCLKDFMWASGSSSVMLLGIDLSRAKPAQLDVLSRFIDGVNQHWTLIAQRDVSLPMTSEIGSPTKSYRFFAIQMTGGGNFPSRLVRPDFLLNLLCTTEKLYGLDVNDYVIYDLVQSRGCGRAVSAQNAIAFQKLASNAVVNYALGGIGMTTMFANGEKMVDIIENSDQMLKKTDKRDVWPHGLLDGIDYSFMTSEATQISRLFGFNDTLSNKEKRAITGSAIALLFGIAMTTWIYTI